MSSFFKNLFHKKRTAHLQFEEIPGWLSEKEGDYEGEIALQVSESRKIVEDALKEIREMVSALSEEEVESDHPKLSRIVEHGLPSFKDSMTAVCSSKLSGSPGEFYDNCVLLVQGFSRCLTGTGRYIRHVFPEEMKEIRLEIDLIGRQLNIMTREMKPYLEHQKKVKAIRNEYETIIRLFEEYDKINREKTVLSGMLVQISHDIEETGDVFAVLSEGERMRDALDLQSKKESLSRNKEEILSEYSAFVVVSSNVLRKVEYTAEKEGDPDLSRALHTIRGILESPLSRETGKICSEYRSSYPSLRGILEKNSSILKNKKQNELFSSSEVFCRRLESISLHFNKVMEEIRLTDTEISKIEIIDEVASCEKRLNVLREDLARCEGEINDAQRRAPEICEEVPSAFLRIRDHIQDLAGDEWEIEIEEPLIQESQ